MNFEGTRFTVEPCPLPRCGLETVRCITAKGAQVVIDAAPHEDGSVLVRDTGGSVPIVEQLVTAKQFGRQGQLHRRHNATCKGMRYGRR